MSLESYEYQNISSFSINANSICFENIIHEKENNNLNFEQSSIFNNQIEISKSFYNEWSFLNLDNNIISCQHENCTKKIFVFLSIKNKKNYIEFLCEDNHRYKIEISDFIDKIDFNDKNESISNDYDEGPKIKQLKTEFRIIEERKIKLEEKLKNKIITMNKCFLEFKECFYYHLKLIRLKEFFDSGKFKNIFSNIIKFQNFIRLNENFSSNLNYDISSYNNFMNFIENFYNLPVKPSKFYPKDNERFESIKEKIYEKKHTTLKINTIICDNNEKNFFNYNIISLCVIQNNRFGIGFDNGKIIIRNFNSCNNKIEINQFENNQKGVNHLFYSNNKNYLISSWTDNCIRIFEIFLNHFKLIQELNNENQNIKINQTIELIKENSFLVSCDNNKTIIFWKYEKQNYIKEKEKKTESSINSILYINKNKEIVLSLKQKIQFLNIESNNIDYSINIRVNNYGNCSDNLILLKQNILAVKGRMNEGIYLVNLKNHSIINQLLIGRTINSFCKINDNFILNCEYDEEKNSNLFLYEYELNDLNLIDSKFNINKNSINSIISNHNFIITSTYDKSIYYWNLIETNVYYDDK